MKMKVSPMLRTLAGGRLSRFQPVHRCFAASAPNDTTQWEEHKTFVQTQLVDTSLKGVGQVIFLNDRRAGMILLGGLAYGDPFLASMAAWGSVVSTATAHGIGLDKSTLQAGLYGYNGCLVGCASAVFVNPTFLASTTGAFLCPLVGTAIGNGLMTKTPQWTLAFNFVTLSMLLRTKPLQISDSDDTTSSATEALAPAVTDLVLGPLKGLSQIFVVESAISGAIVLAGIYSYSPLLAAHALMGSTVGTVMGASMSAPSSELAMGLWGFNSALTSMAIGVFFVPNKETTALSVVGAATTAGLFGALKTVMGDWGTPALTMPFCITMTGCYWLAGSVPGLLLAKEPHSPEKNET